MINNCTKEESKLFLLKLYEFAVDPYTYVGPTLILVIVLTWLIFFFLVGITTEKEYRIIEKKLPDYRENFFSILPIILYITFLIEINKSHTNKLLKFLYPYSFIILTFLITIIIVFISWVIYICLITEFSRKEYRIMLKKYKKLIRHFYSTLLTFNFILFFIWFSFICLIGIAVLYRIINRTSYVFLGFFMYFIIYFLYSIKTKHTINFLKSKNIFQFLEYILNHFSINLSIILLFAYSDLFYYAKDKLAKILINKIKGENFNWWKPYDDWWEL